MRGFPFVIIAVLFCLNALDGFDALAISFAAPGMTHEWGTSPQALGVSFPGGCSRPVSAHWGSLRWPIGSAGMALGSLLGAAALATAGTRLGAQPG